MKLLLKQLLAKLLGAVGLALVQLGAKVLALQSKLQPAPAAVEGK